VDSGDSFYCYSGCQYEASFRIESCGCTAQSTVILRIQPGISASWNPIRFLTLVQANGGEVLSCSVRCSNGNTSVAQHHQRAHNNERSSMESSHIFLLYDRALYAWAAATRISNLGPSQPPPSSSSHVGELTRPSSSAPAPGLPQNPFPPRRHQHSKRSSRRLEVSLTYPAV
jgi:hypothetical protein